VGVDFITKCTKTYRMSWEHGREKLVTQDLFVKHPEVPGRSFRASHLSGDGYTVGEELLLHRTGDDVAVFRGRGRVGDLRNPPPGVLGVIDDAGGAVCARVERTHARSGDADIAVIS
jgi:hypothetical protein